MIEMFIASEYNFHILLSTVIFQICSETPDETVGDMNTDKCKYVDWKVYVAFRYVKTYEKLQYIITIQNTKYMHVFVNNSK